MVTIPHPSEALARLLEISQEITANNASEPDNADAAAVLNLELFTDRDDEALVQLLVDIHRIDQVTGVITRLVWSVLKERGRDVESLHKEFSE